VATERRVFGRERFLLRARRQATRRHVLAIATLRPDLLRRQVSAFARDAQQMSGQPRELHIVVLEDTGNVKDFLLALEDPSEWLGPFSDHLQLRIDLWSLEKQLELLQQLRAVLEPDEARALSFYTEEPGQTRSRGIRAVQNKLDLIVSHQVRKPALMTRLDDDVLPHSVWLEGELLRVGERASFFAVREQASDSGAVLLGAPYVGDGPSPIADLDDALHILRQFLDGACTTSDPGAEWAALAAQISPRIACQVDDPDELLQGEYLTSSGTFAGALDTMARLSQLMLRGICRFRVIYREYFDEVGWFGPREFTPGGAITTRLGSALPPVFPAANQDVLWTSQVAREYGVVLGVQEVLHLKGSHARASLLQEFRSTSKHDFVSTFAVHRALVQSAPRTFATGPVENSLGEDFQVKTARRIESSLSHAAACVALLDSKHAWWSSPAHAQQRGLLRDMCLSVLTAAPELRRSVSEHQPRVDPEQLVLAHRMFERTWPSLRRKVSRLAPIRSSWCFECGNVNGVPRI
jgi:hypothetical protein